MGSARHACSTALPSIFYLLLTEFSDANIPVPNRIAVVLQAYFSRGSLAEGVEVLELRLCDHGVPFGAFIDVFDLFLAVKPVLGLAVGDDEFYFVPLAYGLHVFFGNGDEILEVTGAVGFDFTVGVAFVVEHLHLGAGEPGVVVAVFGDVVDDAAIAVFTDLPL